MSPMVLAVNFICYAFWFTAIGLLLPARLSLPKTALWTALSFFPYFYLTTALTLQLTVLRLLLGLCFVLAVTALLFRGSWRRKLLVVFLVMVMMLLSEFLTVCIVPGEVLLAGVESGVYAHQAIWYGIYLFCQALLLSALVFAGRTLMRRREGASGGTLLFLLFPFSQLLLLAGLFRPVSTGQLPLVPAALLLALLLCVLADLGLAAAMVVVSRRAALEGRSRALQAQIREQGAYYARLAASHEQIRRLRHDLDNHLYTVRILIEDGKTEEAARYARELAAAQKVALQGGEAEI